MEPDKASEFESRLRGCLLGGAVGDALGLPMEGIKRARAGRMFRGPVRHRLLFGKGMISDDTEHALFTALALARAKGDEERFVRGVARGMRAWLATLPAGAGLATLKATLKLCIGVSPHKSGVRSAGNGPAMRAPIIGAYFADNVAKIAALCRAVEPRHPHRPAGSRWRLFGRTRGF